MNQLEGMCGITGFYHTNYNYAESRGLIRDMVSVLQHRGPDAWGYYTAPKMTLGQTRLSIVDLAGGNQPMEVDDYIISFNGEIFNYIELKAELKSLGVKFISNSDTEVLLRVYIQFGVAAFEKLNGQFAALIWNRKTEELIAVRDRFGIRPLYYLHHNGAYYFASEMKVFDKIPGFERDFNAENLFEHALLWNTLGERTVYESVNSLSGGSYALFKNKQLQKVAQYYQLGTNKERYSFSSYTEAEEAFTTLMDDAVKLRLRSDVPVGAYLSGGIDSSVILSLIKSHTKNIFKTFSVGFDDKEYDESKYQKEMVNMIHSDHYAELITYDKVDANFPEAIYHTERPVFRTAPVPLYLLSKKVRNNDIKVVLTGEGADEILWGYDSYKEIQLLEFWSKYPESEIRPLLIKKLYPHLNNYNSAQNYGMMRMFYEGFLGQINNSLASANIRVNNNQILQNYFNKSHGVKFDLDALLNRVNPELPPVNGWGSLHKNQFVEMRTLLAGYLLSSRGDRMSMAHSVEGRYPFLDHRVVDMLFYIKDNYKLNGFNQKYMLKKAYANRIPQSIVNRPKRPYMSPDLRSFIKSNKLTDNAAFFLNDELVKDYGIFNPKWVNRFLHKFKNGMPENIGYRDNMIICFLLSAQIAKYWAKNPREYELSEELLTVEINDHST